MGWLSTWWPAIVCPIGSFILGVLITRKPEE